MSICLGIDTSNYTTSAALYDSSSGKLCSEKKLLPVKPGELGLRQSDAVFHHTVQLPDIIEKLFSECDLKKTDIDAVGASSRPRDIEGSYMPCFLAGSGTARCLSAVNGVPFAFFSHQAGHIAAALFSAERLELLNEKFVAFHVSGGTTEVVTVEPDSEKIIRCTPFISSLDLKAGQAVDRVGVMLGMSFPAGMYVDEAARKSEKKYKIKIKLKDGCCSLSGLQNKCETMKKSGESDCDICRYCVEYIAAALDAMAEYALEKLGDLSLVFSGGVMSNSMIRERFTKKYGAVFAQPSFSSDNAAGTAVLTSLLLEQKSKLK